MSNKYDLESFADLANIPDDAIPRFIDELPKIIGHLKDIKLLQLAVGEENMKIHKSFTWVDDGKKDLHMEVTVREGD